MLASFPKSLLLSADVATRGNLPMRFELQGTSVALISRLPMLASFPKSLLLSADVATQGNLPMRFEL